MKSVIFFALLFSSVQAFSQSQNYQVYALRFASMGHPSPIADWVDHAPRNDSINIDFMVWLVRGN